MMDHLLLHCDVAYVLWSGVFMIFWVLWEILSTVADIIWMKELVWEALFRCLESYSVMFDVDSVEGKE